MLILFVSLANFIFLRADDRNPHISQPMPPEIPRARHPFPHKRAPPAHDPMSYAKLHGMSLETDEEGNYRIGGIAQEGYESLYFDPAATTTAAAPQPKKRRSRSSEAISKEIDDGSSQDSTRIILSFEPEGSGDDGQVIMDTVLEIIPDNDKALQFVDGSPFVGNFDPYAAWNREKLEKLKKLELSAKFSPIFERKPIIVSRKSAKIVRQGSMKRLPLAGHDNTVKIPFDRLLQNIVDYKQLPARQLKRSQIENTAILNRQPETLIIMGASEFRGRSMRALRQGRGTWNRSRLSRFVNQQKAMIFKKFIAKQGMRRSLRKTRDQ